jgi:hypothetical protein
MTGARDAVAATTTTATFASGAATPRGDSTITRTASTTSFR